MNNIYDIVLTASITAECLYCPSKHVMSVLFQDTIDFNGLEGGIDSFTLATTSEPLPAANAPMPRVVTFVTPSESGEFILDLDCFPNMVDISKCYNSRPRTWPYRGFPQPTLLVKTCILAAKTCLIYAFVTQPPFGIPSSNLGTCIFVASTI